MTSPEQPTHEPYGSAAPNGAAAPNGKAAPYGNAASYGNAEPYVNTAPYGNPGPYANTAPYGNATPYAAPAQPHSRRTLWLVLGAVGIAVVCFFSGAVAATGFITVSHSMHQGIDRPGHGAFGPGGGNRNGTGTGRDGRNGNRNTAPNS
ncbi:hypothetical protein [Glaciibacter flavus]|uniref:hypothetical protein n=1 Tax=Orlajensenia flava TaxID=2565934 RepID=UPI003AFF9EC4